jgi:glycosyltransferase involved in cell wall biosynthesis
MPQLKISYFFRKPVADFYSIELLFDTVIKYLNKSDVNKVFLPYKLGDKLIAILLNCIYARSRQGQINHITGEVYYIALILKKERTILTIHDIDSLISKSNFKNKLLYFFWLYLPVKRVRFVTVVSEYSKSKLLDAVNIKAEKVIVIPNSVPFTENDFKPKATINLKEPVLLQVGTKPNKNINNLILAISDLPCKLIILGKLLKEQVCMLEDANINYEQYHNLTYSEVKALYYKADIVTFISLFEGFGMPILEANTLGRPIITSKTASMPEVAGEGALLVNPYDPLEIRNAINNLLTNDNLRSCLVAAGFKNVQRFKPEFMAARYEELYKRIEEEIGDKTT